MKLSWARLLLTLGAMLCSAFLAVSASYADNSGEQILHHVLAGNETPNPGAPMTLKFEIANSRELERPVRVLVVRDGRMIEVPLLQSYLNERDHPTYEFQLNAPITEIYYQFFAYDAQGANPLVSPPYGFRRPCMPPIELIDTKVDPKTSPADQVRNAYTQSQILGDEIQQYQKTLRTLQDLQELLKD